MRAILILGLLGLATPVLAQTATQLQIDDLRAQQEAAQRRSVDQSNQLQALDARLRADDASATLAAQRAGVQVPVLPYPHPTVRKVAPAMRTYPSMPGAALKDSDKRVQDAARTPR